MDLVHRSQIPIPEPCPEDLSSVAPDGSGRRHCDRCRKSVHDLSEMTRAQAKLVVLRSRREEVCVRYACGADGQLRFRPSPTRARGPLITALAGFALGCTGTGEKVDAPSIEEIDWGDEANPTIPDQDPRLTIEHEPGIVRELIVESCSTVSMIGGAVIHEVHAGLPAIPVPHEPFELSHRIRGSDGSSGAPSAPLSARQKRKAERKERRRRRKAAKEAERQARRVEREYQRELVEAEREVQRETRQAERRRRRAERRQRRALRREARRARREARRTRRVARRAARRGDGRGQRSNT
ncbi:MAG: hypothetical protein AAF799_32575 [Myxococcota bacterium]